MPFGGDTMHDIRGKSWCLLYLLTVLGAWPQRLHASVGRPGKVVVGVLAPGDEMHGKIWIPPDWWGRWSAGAGDIAWFRSVARL